MMAGRAPTSPYRIVAGRLGSQDERALFASLGAREPAGLWDDLAPPKAANLGIRERLFKALSLLMDAGYRLKDGRWWTGAASA